MAKIKKIVKTLILLSVLIPLISHGAAWDVSNLEEFGLPGAPISGETGIIFNVLYWMLDILGALGVLGFVISGVQYLTAAGDEDQIKTAKNTMKYSIIGVAVGISGWVIIYTIDSLLY